MNQSPEPGRAPWRSAGSNPALTTEDFPLPLGPTTARKLACGASSPSLSTNWVVSADWAPDGNDFVYRNITATGWEWIRVDASAGVREPAFDHAALASVMSRLNLSRDKAERYLAEISEDMRNWFHSVAMTSASAPRLAS